MIDQVINADLRSHWVKITVKKTIGSEPMITIIWETLRWELRQKYDWYFKYRRALLQVQNPKMWVEMTWGNDPSVGKPLAEALSNKIRNRKAKITEYTGKLKQAERTWVYLFPIQDDANYQKAVAKIEKAKAELEELINEQTKIIQAI
jgi:hypothetical protein